MKSKRFEDSISSRFLINVIDVVLLCVGFFLAHYAFLHSGQNYVTMPETQRNLVIAIILFLFLIFLFFLFIFFFFTITTILIRITAIAIFLFFLFFTFFSFF